MLNDIKSLNEEVERLRNENKELKKKVKKLEVTVDEWKTAKWFEIAQSVQSFRMNPYRNF